MTLGQYEALYKRLRPFYSEQDIYQWLKSPQKLLAGRRPNECSFADVDGLITDLEERLN